MAEVFYGGVPEHIAQPTRDRLAPELLSVVDRFRQVHGTGEAPA